jgi:ADP-ribose pyrophosphatase
MEASVTSSDQTLAGWETLSEKTLCEVPRLRVVRESVRLQNGNVVDDYYQIIMGSAAAVAACRDDGRFVMLRMYKHGPRRAGIGFPGGGVEEEEEPDVAAKRELLEETGYVAREWRALGGYTVHSNQGCGFVNFFVAFGAMQVQRPVAEDLEPHEFVYLTREEIISAMRSGQFLSMGHVCLAGLVVALTEPDAERG